MRSFNVFSDHNGDYRAVKQGWCWPAFFFGSIWALFSGIWLVAFLLLPIDFVFSIAGNSANDGFDPYGRYDETTRFVVLAVFSIPLAIRLLLGLFGNSLRVRKLRRLGFSHVGRVKANGKEHAISLCKTGANAETSSPRMERPLQLLNEPRGGTAPASDTASYIPSPDESQSHVLDSFLLIVAVAIGVVACLSVIGLLPAAILLFGLAVSIKSGNRYYLKTVTRIVCGIGYAIIVVSSVIGLIFFPSFLSAINSETGYVSYGPPSYSLAAFWIAGLSLANIFALRYFWLNPLLRQFDAIRTFLFGIKMPEMPKKPKVQKIISRDGLQPYSVADEIAKWKALHDQGVIDDAEYRQARSRLLNPT